MGTGKNHFPDSPPFLPNSLPAEEGEPCLDLEIGSLFPTFYFFHSKKKRWVLVWIKELGQGWFEDQVASLERGGREKEAQGCPCGKLGDWVEMREGRR
jgi:hypothetical protein